MRKLILSTILAATAAFSFAQGLGFKLDAKSGEWAPVASFQVASFDTLLNFKIKSELIAFAGTTLEGGKLVGGGAWVIPFDLAGGTTSLKAYAGPSLEFDIEGRPWKFGFVFGVRF